jgi:hypothetical protein
MIALFILFVFSSYLPKEETQTIKVHIEIFGQDINTVTIKPPNIYFKDPAIFRNLMDVASGHHFDFSIPLKQASFIYFAINKELNMSFAASPGDSISFEIKRTPTNGRAIYALKISGWKNHSN